MGILILRMPEQYRIMGLKCEPPSLVLVLQMRELNERSDTIGEVVAEGAELRV